MRLIAKFSTKMYPNTDFEVKPKIGSLDWAEHKKMQFFAYSPTHRQTIFFDHENGDFSALPRAIELKIGI